MLENHAQPKVNRTILIVDDDESIRRLLCQLVGRCGLTTQPATDAAEARKLMKRRPFDLVLCDIEMPGESGFDFARYIMSKYPSTAVIMITGVDDIKIAEKILEIGAYGYIIKPFSRNQLQINIYNALRRRDLEIQNRTHRENLEKQVVERTASLQKTTKQLGNAMNGIIEAMGVTVEKRDPYTAGHQDRVSRIAFIIAERMELPETQVQGVRMAGLIHDIGKITVPAEILSKPGKISEYEFGIIRSHSQVGYDILKKIDFPWPISQIVLQHHERVNGSGYPKGLSGPDILLEAKIIAVADVVEAMSSHRPYRPALGIESALNEIFLNKGVFYDPAVVDALFLIRSTEIEQLLA